MRLEDFQDDHLGAHLRYRNRKILAILNLYFAPMPPIKFWLNPLYGLGGDVVWRFSRWRPSWISERNVLAILNLHVAPMPPIKFGLNLSGFGSKCDFKMAAQAAILDSGMERFSISESLCRSDASHQVSALSVLRFGRRCRLKNYKMAGDHLGYRNGTILAIMNLYVAQVPPMKFQPNQTYGLGADVIWRISKWSPLRPSLISETILAILNFLVATTPPVKFRLNLTCGLGGEIIWRISRWPSLISERNDF